MTLFLTEPSCFSIFLQMLPQFKQNQHRLEGSTLGHLVWSRATIFCASIFKKSDIRLREVVIKYHMHNTCIQDLVRSSDPTLCAPSINGFNTTVAGLHGKNWGRRDQKSHLWSQSEVTAVSSKQLPGKLLWISSLSLCPVVSVSGNNANFASSTLPVHVKATHWQMVTWNHGRKGILGNVFPPLWCRELTKSKDDAELSVANS